METQEARAVLPGGGFLIDGCAPADVLTPEDLKAEHQMVRKTAADFVAREILPRVNEIERQNWEITRGLLRKLGGLGFLAPDLPAEYGGGGMDSLVSLVIAEQFAVGSFSATYGAHAGIGMLPIAFFGTEAQKRRYLPAMARGDLVGAYALTEPTAGSDALSIRTRAVLSPDRAHYLLIGQKQFITNAAIADIFVTYAKVDGDQFTAFIVDRGAEGFGIGAEEEKMGMKGSSTRGLFFENARVPVENLLGEVGKGHRVAFNILNLGRFKLGAWCVGAAKHALSQAAAYACERRQFGKALAEFGLIRQKLGRIASAAYAAESMVYRTGGLVEGAIGGIRGSESVVRALEEYAIESSITKVFASEMLDRTVDELVQIYGGYGYIEAYPAARAYRDARINRIWEGTNEVNRMLIVDMLTRRAMRGRLNLMEAMRRVAGELTSMAPAAAQADGPLAEDAAIAAGMKKAALFCAGAAVQKYGAELEHEQEILAWIADLAIEAFAAESGVLRAQKAQPRGDAGAEACALLARAYIEGALPRVETAARNVLSATDEGDTLRTELAGLRRLLRHTPASLMRLERAVAEKVIAAQGYPL